MSEKSVARLLIVNTVIWIISSVISSASAEDYFNLSVLETDSPLENTGALKEYLKNNGVSPGRYLTQIIWGQDKITKKELDYVFSRDKKKVIPQFTKDQLRQMGVKVDSIRAFAALTDGDVVGDIADYIPEASYDFSPDTQTLQLRIPQIYRDAAAAGEIAPEYWDDGIPALWGSYYVSGSQQRNSSGTTSHHWANVSSGLNLGSWRLRNYSTWADDDGWQSISTTLQRDIKSLKSQLEMGQTYTNGELFDSVQMSGIKLETDTSMLPGSQQGFAPVVRGIANSDAKVTVKQNGYTIYQTYVSAGPFEIRDLSQVTAGTDLEVTVEEADGTKRSFIQASSSVPVLQREGALKYSIAAGRYRDSTESEEPSFGQATAIYGLPYGVTVYAGLLGASIYQSWMVGAGADLRRLGSVSMDFTAARSSFDDAEGNAKGGSWRAQYAKDFPTTDTTVTLASYRYSTAGFYTFQEAIEHRNYSHGDDDDIYSYRNVNNRRSRLQVNLSQSLGEWGALYINGYQQDYWHLAGHERSATMGYSSHWGNTSWSLNYSLTKTPSTGDDRQISLTINVPLSKWLTNAWATYTVNRSHKGNTAHQAGLSGTLLEDNNFSYNLQQNYTDNNVGYGGYLSGRYRASVGEFSSGYSYQGDNRQWNYSAQGSIVAHPHGVTLGRSIQDAFAVVHIAEGGNVGIQNSQGIVTDYWGNAIVPTLTNYRHNAITVNTQKRSDLDIQDASLDVIPTKGAAVAANFSARVGHRALLTLKYRDGVVPFGALLSMDGMTSIVGSDGEVYITGLKAESSFHVQWGSAADTQCHGEVSLPESPPTRVILATVNCQ